MKAKKILSALVAMALMSSCAELGFGIDVDSGDYSPYYNGYYGSPWGNIGFNWDYPLYAPPGPPLPPRPVRPPQQAPSRPQQPPQGNGVPTTSPGGSVRPGNGGLPSANTPATQPDQIPVSNNARRGR